MDLNLEGIRYVEMAKLILPILKRELARKKAERLGIDYDRPKFYGLNPLTGVPVTIIFNEPAPDRSSVMNWNPLTRCWFYSEDAGLTWRRVEKNEFSQYIERVDCLMDKPRYDG